ncbi:hypothetical protein NDU88_001336 [Pleurodeles waltl]|uniref:Uncharacterized protein n=1 Tax=Pleurodeles waltl TaxID=8319 RepID=A0AAV7U7U3_PLEWA|nr:hypothetical protein NDU88_001336 [Pleurodeles waltl]
MGKTRPARTPAPIAEMSGTSPGSQDSTTQALRQMESTLLGHTSQGLPSPLGRGAWKGPGHPPKRKRDRRARSGNKPTKAQSGEERTRLLRKATQFVSNPYLALNALPDTDAETTRADSSYAGDSHQGPSLTPWSADDI